MTEYNLVEEYFMKVDQLFSEGEYTSGKRLLEEILEMEPAYGKAHNHLGWVYYAKIDNYERAIYHYRLAIKFEPEYPEAYINLSYVLVLNRRFDEARENAAAAMKVPAMNRSVISNELGRIEELNGNFKEALKHYREATRLCMNKNEMDVYESNINRSKKKLEEFGRKFLLF